MIHDTYEITAVLKVKTDIITSIAVRLIGRTVILVIMYVETFKTDVNLLVFLVLDVIMWRSDWPIFSSIRVTKLILIISLNVIKGKMSYLMIKNILLLFSNVTLYQHHLTKSSINILYYCWYVLLEVNFSLHLRLLNRCDISLRNSFLQDKSIIAYIYYI